MRIIITAVICLATLFASVGALSHHSFSAEFDVGRPVELRGTVTRMEWTNPHAWMHMDVEDEEGRMQSWAIEFLGVNALVRGGMSPKTVKAGDRLTVKGYGSRDGTNTANASSAIRTESGEALWTSAGADRN